MTSVQSINDQIEKDVQFILKTYDADKDGDLTFEEVYNYIEKRGKKGTNATKATFAIFKKLDTNRDDVISLEELRKESTKIHYDKLVASEVEKLIGCHDTNKDKSITLEEMKENFMKNGNLDEEIAFRMASEFFDELDLDKNGKVTYDEVQAFVRKDLNYPSQ